VEDSAQYDLSNGPIPLRWKDEYLERPVLRHVTAEGPQDVPLTKKTFCECLRVIFTAAGYTKRPTVYNIQKFLGKKIKGRLVQHYRLVKKAYLLISNTGKYGSALVSQIYGHKDPGTYAKDYVLHCSSINTVATVLDENPDEEGQLDHIEYFQGFERFYERGLPGELPAEIEQSVLEKPELMEIKSRIEHLQAQNDNKKLIAIKRINYRKVLLRHRLLELKEY
jgi:hypothetical protein